MKKLIIKTAAITLAAIILTALLIYGALAAFSPKSLAEFYDNAGNAGLAREYYARTYEKSGDINDLYVFCVKADEKGDAAKSAKYLEVITDKQDFEEFCRDKDVGYTVKFSTADFLRGKCVAANYYAFGINKAVESALSFTGNAYAENNAFTLFISRCVKDFSAEDKAALSAALENFKASLTNENDVARLNADVEAVTGA